MGLLLSESAALLSPADGDLASRGIWRARIIEADVQGSSGYYPAETLRLYGASAFPAGTQIYFDHPSATEESDRPERSVRDLAGILLDDARYEDGPDGKGLFGRIQFFENVRDQVRAMAQYIGLSIRANGHVEETAQGRIVRSLQGISIDLVTRAGAGGRLIRMSESTTGTTNTNNASISNAGISAAVTNANQVDHNELTKMLLEMREAFLNQTVGLTKLTHLLKERDRAAAEREQHILSMRENFGKVLEADLPNSSKARIIESYQDGHDMDDCIRRERDYLKSVLRERDLKGNKNDDKNASNLGLSESVLRGGSDAASGTDAFSEIEAVLSGKLF